MVIAYLSVIKSGSVEQRMIVRWTLIIMLKQKIQTYEEQQQRCFLNNSNNSSNNSALFNSQKTLCKKEL